MVYSLCTTKRYFQIIIFPLNTQLEENKGNFLDIISPVFSLVVTDYWNYFLSCNDWWAQSRTCTRCLKGKYFCKTGFTTDFAVDQALCLDEAWSFRKLWGFQLSTYIKYSALFTLYTGDPDAHFGIPPCESKVWFELAKIWDGILELGMGGWGLHSTSVYVILWTSDFRPHEYSSNISTLGSNHNVNMDQEEKVM